MPTVAQSLGTDLLGVSWALLSYQLSNIGLSVVFGRISDLWGREKMFALGFLVFAVSSLLCGLSQSVMQLILSRFAQGVGGAMLQSSSRALAVGVGDRRSRRSGARLYDHGASRRIHPWAEHRRHHDRLLQLALEFFPAGAGRIWRRNTRAGKHETSANHAPQFSRIDRLSGRGVVVRHHEHFGLYLRPAHPRDCGRLDQALARGGFPRRV